MLIKTYGPYIRKDGRKHVIHYYSDGKKVTQSYPRYLMEQHLGRKLLDEETVDHDDEDFTNDDLSNLKLLSREANALKSIVPAELVDLICKYCGASFKRRKVVEHYNRVTRETDGPFCSKHCVGKMYH